MCPEHLSLFTCCISRGTYQTNIAGTIPTELGRLKLLNFLFVAHLLPSLTCLLISCLPHSKCHRYKPPDWDNSHRNRESLSAHLTVGNFLAPFHFFLMIFFNRLRSFIGCSHLENAKLVGTLPAELHLPNLTDCMFANNPLCYNVNYKTWAGTNDYASVAFCAAASCPVRYGPSCSLCSCRNSSCFSGASGNGSCVFRIPFVND